MAVRTSFGVNGTGDFPVSVTSSSFTSVTGDTLVVMVACNSSDSIANTDVSDSYSNTFTRIGNIRTLSGPHGAIFYAEGITGGSGHTVTFQRSNANVGSICGVVLSGRLNPGLNGTPVIDELNASSTDLGPFNLTTSATADVIIGAISFGGTSWSIGPGYSIPVQGLAGSIHTGIAVGPDQVAGLQSKELTNATSSDQAGVMLAFATGPSGANLSALGGAYTLTGTAAVLRPGSTVYLRHRK